jgi:tRNA (guanosine-2'-O-)-methyltransferase
MTHSDRQLLQHLLEYLTPQRQLRFAEVLDQRTRRITVVLEDMYGSHNIGAVLRTCDAFGIQDVHVIEDTREFQLEPEVALGSQKWLTLHRYREVPDPRGACVAALRQAGYRLLAASPHAGAPAPEEIDVSVPSALLFGTEKDGLTSELQALADGAVRIPMCGFVESLNVSVAAAVCLYPMVNRLRRGPSGWGLTEAEREPLLLEWVRKSVPHVEALEARYRQRQSHCPAEISGPRPAAVDR